MMTLFEGLKGVQANIYVAVLAASRIHYRLEKTGPGWSILVHDEDLERALKAVSAYISENPELPRDKADLPEFRKTFAGLCLAAGLAAVHAFIARGGDSRIFLDAYGSSASRIVGGEYYRVVTALLLHADIAHLAGNVIGIALFGSAICSLFGWGAGCLMILLSGAAGNLMNAMMHQTGHVSIGASTAVFGAIGILTGYQFHDKFKRHTKRAGAWLSLGGGLALLGMLGSGPFTDIMAHFWGFLAGMALGVLHGLWGRHARNTVYQAACGAIAAAMIAGSWIRGF
ncbi:MAG: rhomboid family intramembrane serine protease [Desulfobacterales bacterium]|nr:rhomboid family intramembrane serine protease [Desulfobacterales bacterium]MDD3081329.1 rhomboid family intramembrane serine protease [Desulfobacterales bacterium]MDD3951432.1 rhomboid family intramembrane serine protease [Desulfobacterales bacterium]